MDRYRAAARPFAEWLTEHGFGPTHATEWDDLIVEYKNDRFPKKSEFENLVAAIELLFPGFKGMLKWSRQVLAGWAVAHVPQHTVPLSSGPAHLIATHMAALGQPRLGVGLLLQQKLGLRPNEMLNIEARDVQLPDLNFSASVAPAVMIGLGVRTGTKAKRAQSVVLRDPILMALLAWAAGGLQGEDRLFPFTYENYRRVLKKITTDVLHLNIHWTPHSARAGFASDHVAMGTPFIEIREAGRWVADSRLRTYIDIVGSASIATSLQLSGFKPAILYACSHILSFFPCAEAYLRDHVEAGPSQSGGRIMGSRVGRQHWSTARGISYPQVQEAERDDSESEDSGGRKAAPAPAGARGAPRARLPIARGRGFGRR